MFLLYHRKVNMIPVSNNYLIEIDISKESDIAYRSLLQNQFRELLSIQDTIYKKAKSIYELFVCSEKLSSGDLKIKDRCCDFLFLEQKMKEYAASK